MRSRARRATTLLSVALITCSGVLFFEVSEAGAAPCDASDSCGPTFMSGPAEGSILSRSSLTFTFSRPDAWDYWCSMDTAAPFRCASPVTYSSLSEGSHTFSVAAHKTNHNLVCNPSCYDDASMGALTENSDRHFTLDRTAPGIAFTGGPFDLSTVRRTSTTFAFAASDLSAVTLQCSVDNARYAPCTSPKPLLGLRDGPHKLLVVGTDAAGNMSGAAVRAFAVKAKKVCRKRKLKKNGKVLRMKNGKVKTRRVCKRVGR
jgi:hypothetical protein